MNDNTTVESGVSMRYINVAAVKQHALRCSKEIRAGYFERVGQSFIDGVQSETERLIREINSKFQPPIHSVISAGEAKFVTGVFVDRTQQILDAAVARIVQARVQRHPSVGKTLK